MVAAGVALASAGISAFSAKKGRDAAKKASRQQQAGIERGRAELGRFREFGEAAIDPLQGLLGTGPGGVDDRNAFLRNTPGFEFARSEGLRAVDTGFGEAGLFGSGAREKARIRFATNLATQTLGQERNALFRALEGGQRAAGGTASLAAGQGAVAAQGTLGANQAFQTGIRGVVNPLAEAAGGAFQGFQRRQAFQQQSTAAGQSAGAIGASFLGGA